MKTLNDNPAAKWPIMAAVSYAVGRAVIEVLPPEWHVLLDGRATHSVVRKNVQDRLAGRIKW